MSKYSIKKVWNVLKDANFFTDRVRYFFAKLHKKDYPELMRKLSKYPDIFSEVIHDKDELSLIIPTEIWEKDLSTQFQAEESENDLALITCEVQTEQVTGFLLMTSAILSPNNVGVYVQGAFTTDHIFVEYEDLDKAIKLLNQLKED